LFLPFRLQPLSLLLLGGGTSRVLLSPLIVLPFTGRTVSLATGIAWVSVTAFIQEELDPSSGFHITPAEASEEQEEDPKGHPGVFLD
jgi:hypothetical protein